MTVRIERRIIVAALTLISAISIWGAFGAARSMAVENIQKFTVSESTTQAGGHPDVDLIGEWDTSAIKNGEFSPPTTPCGCDDPKDLTFELPAGFIGNPPGVPQCTLALFGLDECPPETQVGTVTLFFLGTVPLYNLVPHPGEAGLQGIHVPLANNAQFTVLHARTGGDYGLDATTPKILHTLPIFTYSNIVIWGVPADPGHDPLRFPTLKTIGICSSGSVVPEPCYPPLHLNGIVERPYLENPTSCEVPLTAGLDLTYYDGESAHADAPWPATTGCDQLSFNPSLTALPTTQQADTAAGLDVDLSVPQTQSPTVPAPSEIRRTVVTVPTGFSINPNAADGKTVCTDTEAAFGTEEEAHCPEQSKIGTSILDSPALPGPIDGAIYLGSPQRGDTYRVVLTADGFSTHVKLAGSVKPDPQTGRLVVSFNDLPQSPFSDFYMHFFGSERGLLATPTQCGTYPVTTEFTPWDSALGAQTSTTYFTINSGPQGAPCPPPSRPFDPHFQAGTADNTAGVHTPFILQLTRDDGQQNVVGLNLSTPPGFSASLMGIPYCPNSAIEKLTDQSYSGLAEQASSICPAASQVGTVIAGTGAGSHPLYTLGRVFLAGPYKGAPLSLESVVPALSGPYDLGNVAVRTAVHVDPFDAHITAVSDPLPQILGGIPLRLRSILINLDRPDFTINPTNCDPFSIDATIFGDQGATANLSTRFQTGNCADLAFKPKLALKLIGGTKRTGHPAIHATFSARPGDANTKRVSVILPNTEQIENAHLNSICTQPAFAEEACPPGSKIGSAEAVTPLLDQPLTGNVYLRSNPGEGLPNVVVALKGQVDLQLVGKIDGTRNQGLRTTFETIPDVPVTSFSLNLLGARKGLIVNNTNICVHRRPAIAVLEGQNSRTGIEKVSLQLPCGRAQPKRHHARARRTR